MSVAITYRSVLDRFTPKSAKAQRFFDGWEESAGRAMAVVSGLGLDAAHPGISGEN
jgi:hypothetical protein